MSTLETAQENVLRHMRRQLENDVLRARYHWHHDQDFMIGEEIRAIRLRDAREGRDMLIKDAVETMIDMHEARAHS